MRNIVIVLLFFASLGFGNEKVTCALSEIKAKSGLVESDVSLLADRLRLEMYNTGRVTMVEREQMKNILKEQGFQASGVCDDDGCLVEMGQLLGVKYIVAGSMGKLGTLMMINLRVIDVETGTIVKVVNRDIKGGIEDVVSELPNIAANLVPGGPAPKPREETFIQEEKEEPKKEKTAKKDSAVRLQLLTGLTLGSSRVVPNGFGGGATIGFQVKRHILRLMGEFYFPNEFISGGGLSYGYDCIKSKSIVLAPTLIGGFWYGDARPGEGFVENMPAFEAFDFGGISLLYEMGEGKIRFFMEPIIRMGSADDDREEETVTTFQYRFLATCGITILFK